MPKKKKVAANPARGVATTSVASKTKPEKVSSDVEPQQVKEEKAQASPNGPQIAKLDSKAAEPSHEPERHTSELSPEELEQRLEDGELQLLVDKYRSKAQKDSVRYSTKLLTDQRVLRGHAQPFTLKGVLPDVLLQRVLQLAADDLNTGKIGTTEDQPNRKVILQEDDATSRLWTLQLTLIALGFQLSDIRNCLGYIIKFPPPATNSSNVIWSLEECLDWLALTIDEADLPHAEGRRVGARALIGASSTDTPSGTGTPALTQASTGTATPEIPAAELMRTLDKQEPSQEETVSDLDSDIEPDELLAVYVTTKLRLLELTPGIQRTRGKRTVGNNMSNKSSSTVKKLENKLKQIESDMLFNKQEAEQQLLYKRHQKAQEDAERRRLQLPVLSQSTEAQTSNNQSLANMRSPSPTRIWESDSSDDDADTAFADLFGAEGTVEQADGQLTAPSAVSAGTSIAIRDFGPVQGLAPWRVLEEACRARDSRCTLKFQIVSQSAFSHRQSVSIGWSKPQDFHLAINHDAVISTQSSDFATFTMSAITTPDPQQSKAFISTFALFQIFSTSSTEDKVYLRLGPSWRDLWAEFVALRQEQVDAINRETVRELRDVFREAKSSYEEPEDVVFTKNFNKRNERSPEKNLEHDRVRNGAAMEVTNGMDLKQVWHLKSSSPSYRRMLGVRQTLPMFTFREAALSIIEQNQVTILCGETGCGKSTQMPSFILERELSQGRPCKIYCTEPRRISAITLAQRVSEELGENKHDLGTQRSLVGYAIRLENKVSSTTRLVYATTGIVLRMLESAEGFLNITHVVIDEVHERSIETDFLLIILKALAVRRPELKIILMSATVDAQRFSAYFHGAPIITVPGRTFPVDARFLEDAIELTGYTVEDGSQDRSADNSDHDEVETGENVTKLGKGAGLQGYSARTRSVLTKFDEYRIDFQLITSLINSVAFNPELQAYSKAILVFLPGIAEIRRLNDMLHGTHLSRGFIIHMLHSTVASEDQQAAFTLPPPGFRKIVLSTNIAETGVTIPDITCVIDTGKHKEMRFDERRQVSRLLESFISRANAKQRRGRAGRVQEGICFHLFTKTRHDELIAEQQTPEMLRLSLQDLVMRVKICKLGDIQSTLAEALDPPQAKNVRRAIDALIDVGALSSSEGLTPLGQQLSKLPLDPYLGKLVLFGALFGCLDICLTLAAMLTSKSPFVTSIGTRSQLDGVRQYFKNGDSDLLTDFNAYAAWRRVCTNDSTASNSSEAQFCRKNLLSLQTLCNIEDLKAQLLSNVAETGMILLSSEEKSALSRVQNSGFHRARRFVVSPLNHDKHATNIELVCSVIAWSLYPKLLTREGKGWRNIATNQAITIHPTSILRGSSIPNVKFLSFYSILQSSGTKNYNASSLTPISTLPLLLLAGDAAFHPAAHVISVDGARLRFALDGWKQAVALKYLRRRLEEIMNKTWKCGMENREDGSDSTGRASARRPNMNKRLQAWMDLFNDIVESWATKNQA